MSIPPAQNGEEAGQVALAAVSELLLLLISKQVLGDSEVSAMLGRVVNRLDAHSDFASKRAAAFLASKIVVEK